MVMKPPLPLDSAWLAWTTKSSLAPLLPTIVMGPRVKMSIHEVPSIPPDCPVSASTSPKLLPVPSIVSESPAQISTHARELAGLSGRKGGTHLVGGVLA